MRPQKNAIYKKKTKVIVFGTFDLLHPGHLSFLAQAKKQGILTVVITRDEVVKTQKYHAPIFSEHERMKMVGALRVVDRVILGDPPGRWSVLKREKPDIIGIGYDQDEKHPALQTLKKKPRIIQLKAFHPKKYNSSKLRN